MRFGARCERSMRVCSGLHDLNPFSRIVLQMLEVCWYPPPPHQHHQQELQRNPVQAERLRGGQRKRLPATQKQTACLSPLNQPLLMTKALSVTQRLLATLIGVLDWSHKLVFRKSTAVFSKTNFYSWAEDSKKNLFCVQLIDNVRWLALGLSAPPVPIQQDLVSCNGLTVERHKPFTLLTSSAAPCQASWLAVTCL